jgi:hypothetical protein
MQVAVQVERLFPHPKYQKIVTHRKKFLCHDHHEICGVGDRVHIKWVVSCGQWGDGGTGSLGQPRRCLCAGTGEGVGGVCGGGGCLGSLLYSDVVNGGVHLAISPQVRWQAEQAQAVGGDRDGEADAPSERRAVPHV